MSQGELGPKTEIGEIGPGEMFDEGGMIYLEDLFPEFQTALKDGERYRREADLLRRAWEFAYRQMENCKGPDDFAYQAWADYKENIDALRPASVDEGNGGKI